MTSPRTLLTAWNLKAKKQLGQNFLSDPSTAAMIIDRGGLGGDDIVLEIGAGLGALTIPMAQRVQKVIAVEPDRDLLPLLRAELAVNSLSNVEIVPASILRIDLKELLGSLGRRVIVMGNLPYNISSQVLVQLIAHRRRVARAVFMLQRELAERIAAPPGNKTYGRLSVMLQYCAEVKALATVRSNMFFPQPKVDSTVIEIKFDMEPKYKSSDEIYLFSVIKAAFGKRRKTLKNALSGSDLMLNAARASDALTRAGIDPTRRAETLNVEEFVRLSDCIKAV
jgi:16S rRNA (adenine1518-N6/adenine1519-N6)-dimethyltransferase